MTRLQKIIVVVASLTIVLSIVMLVKLGAEYNAAKEEYSDLEQYATETTELPKSTIQAPEGEEMEEERLRQSYIRSDFPDIEVDFDGLRKINDDVVAWLYVGAVGISYPVVQGEDNEYYLHQTFEDQKNSSGCIFMDWEVNKDLTSWNTFFYGHNMKNGTMFGSLKKMIKDSSLYENDPYIYVFVEEGIYRYKIFSYYLDTPDSKMYWTCDTFKEYRKYIRDALEKSVYDCKTPATEDDNCVTLVTCNGSGAGKKRFFVHGIFIDRYLYE